MKVKWKRTTLMQGPPLVLVTSQAEFDEVLKSIGVERDLTWVEPHQSAVAWTFESPKAGQVSVVALALKTNEPSLIVAGTLAHEAVHVWQNWARHIEEDEPGTEQEAEAIEQIFMHLLSEAQARGIG